MVPNKRSVGWWELYIKCKAICLVFIRLLSEKPQFFGFPKVLRYPWSPAHLALSFSHRAQASFKEFNTHSSSQNCQQWQQPGRWHALLFTKDEPAEASGWLDKPWNSPLPDSGPSKLAVFAAFAWPAKEASIKTWSKHNASRDKMGLFRVVLYILKAKSKRNVPGPEGLYVHMFPPFNAFYLKSDDKISDTGIKAIGDSHV